MKSSDIDRIIEEMTKLRQAIAEAEKIVPSDCPNSHQQEPVAWVDVKDSYEGPYEFHGIERMGVGKHLLYTAPVHASDMSQERVDETAKCGHDWGLVTDDALIEEVRRRGFTIRDAQISSKREWVGLTPTEFNSIKETATTIGYAVIKTVAMLKEKNSG